MTMLDDDQLASLFARAGASFDVPETGPADIVARATGATSDAGPGEDEPDGAAVAADGTGGIRRLAAVAGRHRALSVAACVVLALVVAGTVGALVRSPSGPSVTSGLARTLPPAPLHGTTTLPGGAKSFGVQGALGAPSSAATAGGTGAASPAVTTPTTPPLPSGAVGQSPKIEQTGTLGLAVGRGDLGRTMTSLTALAARYDGFVANSETQTNAGGATPSGSITIQVPVDSFTTLLHQARALGKTSTLTTKATDVTGQYVDLQARLAALESSRQQYLTILARATTIGDVLSVQEQLDTLQSQIEQLQGQLQVLTSQTSYSTLTVTVSEGTRPPRPGPVPQSGLVRAWHDSVGGFVTGVEGLVRVAGPVLFALVCLGLVLVGGRVLWRRYQRHRL